MTDLAIEDPKFDRVYRPLEIIQAMSKLKPCETEEHLYGAIHAYGMTYPQAAASVGISTAQAYRKYKNFRRALLKELRK